MPGLLEAAASAALTGAVLAGTVAAVSTSARLQTEAQQRGAELFRLRQLEHLVDRAALQAGSGPARPGPLSSWDHESVVFVADTDGDGTVEASSSETTALELRQETSRVRVRVRLGRQTMTVLDADGLQGRLLVRDRNGEAAAAGTASVVELLLEPLPARAGTIPRRRLLFALPGAAPP